MASKAGSPGAGARYDLAELSIALVSGLTLAITAIFVVAAPLTGKIAGSRDFVVYWATGQQLVHHANPYDGDAMMRVERAGGMPEGYGVLFMRNPPWALPMAYPLGWIGVRLGTLLWSLALLACLFGSVQMVWQMHGRPRYLLNFLGLSFAPALVCLIVGQTSLFALLGAVLFLRLHRTRPFLAGAALWLCALKPHLFLAFGVVLAAWALMNGGYRILLGAASALAASCALTWWIDPTAWADYAQMMRSHGLANEFVPCWSVALRLWVRPQAMILQSLLPAIGCIWALIHFWVRRRRWDWVKEGGVLLLVSLVAAPYAWIYDGGLAIPGLLQGAYSTRSKVLLVVLAASSLAIEAQMIGGTKIISPNYLWTTPAWLAWFVLARLAREKPRTELAVE
jgi:Glycosyltransferase family 87